MGAPPGRVAYWRGRGWQLAASRKDPPACAIGGGLGSPGGCGFWGRHAAEEPGTGERLWPVQGLSCGPCRLNEPALLSSFDPRAADTQGRSQNPSANDPLPASPAGASRP